MWPREEIKSVCVNTLSCTQGDVSHATLGFVCRLCVWHSYITNSSRLGPQSRLPSICPPANGTELVGILNSHLQPLFLTPCLSFSLYPMAMSEIEREKRKDAGETEGSEGEGGVPVFFFLLSFHALGKQI